MANKTQHITSWLNWDEAWLLYCTYYKHFKAKVTLLEVVDGNYEVVYDSDGKDLTRLPQ